MWITPIKDRTLADVQYAIANQNLVSDLKGAYNLSDIDRVMENVVYLRDLLNDYGRFPVVTALPVLVEADLPYLSLVMDVLRTNVVNVRDAYYQLGHPLIRYGTEFNYTDANALEESLYLTNLLLQSMISTIKYSGTFYSGEVEVF